MGLAEVGEAFLENQLEVSVLYTKTLINVYS